MLNCIYISNIQTVVCTCDQTGKHLCDCADDGQECTDPNPLAWFNFAADPVGFLEPHDV